MCVPRNPLETTTVILTPTIYPTAATTCTSQSVCANKPTGNHNRHPGPCHLSDGSHDLYITECVCVPRNPLSTTTVILTPALYPTEARVCMQRSVRPEIPEQQQLTVATTGVRNLMSPRVPGPVACYPNRCEGKEFPSDAKKRTETTVLPTRTTQVEMEQQDPYQGYTAGIHRRVTLMIGYARERPC